MPKKIKVLVVDNSSVFRNAISAILITDHDINVVGTASNGSIAMQKIQQLNPDVITLDIETPEMDGITALRKIKKRYPSIDVIIFSIHTERGAEITIEALTQGATDFVTKPSVIGSFHDKIENVRTDLLKKIKGCRGLTPTPEIADKKQIIKAVPKPILVKRDIIAIGSSTGGPSALAEVIPRIPKSFRAGILIVQHMPPVFTQKLANHLNDLSKIEVREAKDGDIIKAGLALIAPGGSHMVVKKTIVNEGVVSLNKDMPENHCRPSADVLFRSVAEHYRNKAIGVILTGMGQDGFLGLQVMKDEGAPIIAQNKESCVVWGMPRSVVEAGLQDSEVDIKQIAYEINEYML
ncbi:MAG: protein-glutamate methylesterase/protein-glutamine glutaminase [Candidatus Anammoxibacter sp.]